MLTIATTVINLIVQMLPLLGVGTSSAALVTQIVTTIEQLLPTLLEFIPQFYQSVKNIIQALTADPSTTADQLATLQSLDAQLDLAFEAAATAVDPDAPAPSA